MNEMYVCPQCQANGTIESINPLVGSVRFDYVTCPHCGAAWRVYYEVGPMSREMVMSSAIPQDDVNPTVDDTESEQES